MDSSEIVHGACSCGQITVSIPQSAFPKFSALCHCLNCKAASGSLFVYSSYLQIAPSDISVDTPSTYQFLPKMFRLKGHSRYIPLSLSQAILPIDTFAAIVDGKALLVFRVFIAQWLRELTLSSTIMSRVKEHPERTFLKAGPFAKSGFALPPPVHEQFWRRAEAWEKPVEGLTLVHWTFQSR